VIAGPTEAAVTVKVAALLGTLLTGFVTITRKLKLLSPETVAGVV
jgi:hypothetical protein